jgi:hypothetical protein
MLVGTFPWRKKCALNTRKASAIIAWRYGMMDGVRHPGHVSASPAVDFPVYGIDGSEDGARWLDGFGDRVGDEVRWVRLGHQSLGPGAEIMVETHSKPLADAQAARTGRPALESLAFGAGVVLVNLTLPANSVPRPAGLLRALVKHAAERGQRHEEWTPVTWRVDGAPVPARAWRFAGGWAAFSDAVDGVYLAAAGSGGASDGVTLARLRDGRDYNFDLAEPLHPDVIAASHAAHADGKRSRPQREEWHADQLGLLDAQVR